jgi:hypothetical protein
MRIKDKQNKNEAEDLRKAEDIQDGGLQGHDGLRYGTLH